MKVLGIVLLVAIAASLFTVSVMAGAKESVKIEVVQDDTRDFQGRNYSPIGLAVGGHHTESVMFGLNAIVNGEHVKLVCDEHHHNCTSLTPKIYDGEFDGKKSLWIEFPEPLSGKSKREHYKIAGGW
jgi:hypothetical protein